MGFAQMTTTFLAILPIFILIVTGCVLRRAFLKHEVFWKGIDGLTYYLLFPMLLILEITEADFDAGDIKTAIFVIITATLIAAAFMLLGQQILKMDGKVFSSVFQGGVRFSSYVFLALSQNLFGGEGVALSGIFIAYMLVVTNVLAILVLNHYCSEKKQKSFNSAVLSLVKNPIIVAVVAAIIFNYFDVHFSGALKQTMSYFASGATPLSLMSVGAGLIFVMTKIKHFAVIYAIVLKIIALPLITFALLKLFGVSGVLAQITLLCSSISSAGNAYILSRQMGGDSEAMASIITWSTIASAVSIALIFELLASRL